MASALTTAAFHWSGQIRRFAELGAVHQPDRLFYVSTNVFLPGRPAPKPMPWTVKLDVRAVLQRKFEAFRQHVSQAPLMERTKGFFEQHGAQEFYALVASADPQPATQMTDLFERLGKS
jgi:LmbE family N-acetylglucosaminyl deacetylase